MTIFFTSDTHWFHKNILRLAERPWQNVEDMRVTMITYWNSIVKEGDEVYHLGDLSLGSASKTVDILQQLNGRKYLLWGNHDSSLRRKQAVIDEFEWCRNYHELKIQDADAPRGVQRIILCHYPLLTWNSSSHGSWMLHGHCHGNIDELNKSTTRLDVGVDSSDYAPISYDAVKAIMLEKSYDCVDHLPS
jgi:calcineurin-like phosphoesterase family protein